MRPLGEHHRRLDQLARPRQRPLVGARGGHRHRRQRRTGLISATILNPDLAAIVVAWSTSAGRSDSTQRHPHRRGADPDRLTDRGQAQPLLIKLPRAPDDLSGQLVRALRTGLPAHQPAHPSGVEPAPPAPQRLHADTEPISDRDHRSDVGGDQLYRGQPTPDVVTTIKGERGHPRDKHHPTLGAFHQPRDRTDHHRVGRQ